MKNPLIFPALRESVFNNPVDDIRPYVNNVSPAMIAEFLSALEPEPALNLLRKEKPQKRAEIFCYLDETMQLELAEKMGRMELAFLVSDMSSDDRVDFLKRIPEDRKEAVLPAMARAEREDIRRLSQYPEGTAGAVMSSDYAALTPELSANEAVDKLRREAPDKETIYYAYVVDKNRRLIGYVSLKDLIVARSWSPVGEIMQTNVVFANVLDDQEDVAFKIQKYDLIALPVVKDDNFLVGIVTHDDAMDIITREHTEDMEKMMAIAGEHENARYMKTSAWSHFKNRCGWVVFLSVLGLVSGFIVQRFEPLLIQFAILATFMPMLADTGGNTGSQSASLVIRALALKEISARDIFRVLFKEFKVALPLGILLAVLAWGRVYIFADGGVPDGFSATIIGLAVGTALGLQVLTATLIGALLPLIAHRMRLDPAVVASPALTTVVDITGLIIFFMTAKMILGL